MTIELRAALDRIIYKDEDLILIPCDNEKQQESIRVMLFNKRKNHYSQAQQDMTGITKCEINGQLAIKVYKREFKGLCTLDEHGNLVPVKPYPEEDPALMHIFRQMKKEGKATQELVEWYD